MFKLAHLSDPHLGPLPDPKLLQLLSKRILGYLNWQRNRSRLMGGDSLGPLIEDLLAKTPDHIAVTGDLVNIALPLEITGAREWLDGLGGPDDVSVVPGNHDAYVPGAVKKAVAAWWPYLSGDDAPATCPSVKHADALFPYVRRRGGVALIGVNTGRASGPWFATGRVGSNQAKRLRALLEDLGRQGLFRVIMLHHPPFAQATGWHKRLSDASRIRAVVKRAGAELIVHGHTHIDSQAFIDGPSGPVPVIGVPSATAHPGGHKPAARYNLFSIFKQEEKWHCRHEEHGFTDPDTPVSLISERALAIPG